MVKAPLGQEVYRVNLGAVLDEQVVTVEFGGRRFDFVRRHTHADRVVRPSIKGDGKCNSR